MPRLPLFSLSLCALVLTTLVVFAWQNGDTKGELPKTLTVMIGDVKMEFVLIPKGKFKMGSPPDEKGRHPGEKDFDPEKLHEVEIGKPFYLGKYPVTQEQYQALTGKNPSYFQAGGFGADKVKDLDTKRFPVEMVSWDDAKAFCEKLKDKDKQKRTFRLPTEAQWEYACRAGTTTPFYFGSKLDGKEANCNGDYPYGTDDKGPYKGRTTKVGEYGENKWGLCDMHGNVYQWCQDYYGPCNNDLKTTDPLRSVKYYSDEERRVLRGGSWDNSAGHSRAAYRYWNTPGARQCLFGFRVAYCPD
jgi:formylglycine-generating enzyme required for sulfatase activity